MVIVDHDTKVSSTVFRHVRGNFVNTNIFWESKSRDMQETISIKRDKGNRDMIFGGDVLIRKVRVFKVFSDCVEYRVRVRKIVWRKYILFREGFLTIFTNKSSAFPMNDTWMTADIGMMDSSLRIRMDLDFPTAKRALRLFRVQRNIEV